jgi:hypothetical protein
MILTGPESVSASSAFHGLGVYLRSFADSLGVVLGAPRIDGGCLQPLYTSGYSEDPRSSITEF